MLRGLSIKARITIVLVLLPLISLVVVGSVALVQQQNVLLEQAEQQLTRIVEEKTLFYDSIFRRIQQETQATAAFAEQIYALPASEISSAPADEGRLLLPWTGGAYGSPELRSQLSDELSRLERVGRILDTTVAHNPYLTLGYMGTESGVTVIDDEEVVGILEAAEGFDPRTRPWYESAERSEEPTWTELYVDANTKDLTVSAVAPVNAADGGLIGAVGYDVLLTTLQNDILEIDLGYDHEAFLVNDEGSALVRPGMAEAGPGDEAEANGGAASNWNRSFATDNLLEVENRAFADLVSRMIEGESGIARYEDQEGERNYLVYSPLPSIGASLGTIVPEAEILLPVQDSGRLLVIALVVVIVAALGLGLFVSSQVTRPIEELTVLVDKASRGLVEVQEIPVRRRDEVGSLAASFNRMLANLGTVLRELEKKEKS
ncbi:MAG: HAMP domain-containing protein [Spirochaetes bacterium]|jgi:HAMP domain-containing protein|nr:HAMP domain-containing protein [Spirochaetota bacterium]